MDRQTFAKKSKKKRKANKSTPESEGEGTSTSSSSNNHGPQHDDSARKKSSLGLGKNDTSNLKVKPGNGGNYPYPVDYNDHFETPARAYDDIYPLMEYFLAKKKSKSKKKKKKKNKGGDDQSSQTNNDEATIIYDPYYCAGRAATLLSEVFQRHKGSNMILSSSTIHIQHEKRDFYKDIEQKSVPKFDILVTNPPYSGNHKEKCLEFAVHELKQHGRPFFLLMPNYIATKDYFKKIVLEETKKGGGPMGANNNKIRTFYITPSSKHMYEYDHPAGTGHEIPPFASVWFCGLSYGGGESRSSINAEVANKTVMDAFHKFHTANNNTASSRTGTPRIATSLQDLIQIGGVSGETRRNPRQRRKMRQQAMQRANNPAAANMGGGGSGNVGLNTNSKGGKAIVGKRKSVCGQQGGEQGRNQGRTNNNNNNNKRRKFKK